MNLPVGTSSAGLIVAAIAGVVIAYWTLRRLLGSGDDPTLRFSKSSETGSTSFLVSGTAAVGLVASVLAVGLWVATESMFSLAIPAAAVIAHWIVEKEERT